ncbi:YopX family protein [Cytobacillus massiliigabonensis]|uniref:YopX family protein n=1 Tax=Cytobacillus massiliigabonensis TaxID=1871011 RepID=UPI0015E1391C|nr:YopX family protein [Cytobacillus massiliigabonensis]
MREIKYRGKPIEDYGDIKWFVGSLILSYEDELAYSEADGQGTVPVEWESVGQYTGLRNIHNKEIFEGDVLQDDENFKWIVKYKLGSFVAECSELMAEQLLNTINLYCKIIGNIYENPELINS